MDARACCPRFDPAPWDGKIIQWDNKHFIKGSVRTFFYIPITFGTEIKKLSEKITASGAEAVDNLCLSDHTSRWNMDLYLAVNKEINDAENVNLSGTFFSKVYEGPFRDTGKWCEDFKTLAKERNLQILNWYMWFENAIDEGKLLVMVDVPAGQIGHFNALIREVDPDTEVMGVEPHAPIIP